MFEIRTKRFPRMSSLEPGGQLADRTDQEGRFLIEASILTVWGQRLVFSSSDFSRKAVQDLRYDDPDLPMEITLKPLRLVRARVIETPKDRPQDAVQWRVFSVDPRSNKRSFIPAIGEPGVFWEWGWLGSRFVEGSKNSTRSLEVPLPVGRYKVLFESDTLSRLTDLVVPPGDGPLELPEIHLETLAWVKMMGKAAAEIEAVDIEGRSAKLADYRGKAIVLLFWSSKLDWMLKAIPDLTRIQKRFTQRSLAILAVHDASLTSLADFRTTLEPLRRSIDGEIPINFLLDRAPVGKGTGPVPTQAGEIGSGRSFDRYEATPLFAYIIDNSGRLVLAIPIPYGQAEIKCFSIGKRRRARPVRLRIVMTPTAYSGGMLTMHAIEGTLEDLFGIARSPKPTVAKTAHSHPSPVRPSGLSPSCPLSSKVAWSIPRAGRSRAPTCFL